MLGAQPLGRTQIRRREQRALPTPPAPARAITAATGCAAKAAARACIVPEGTCTNPSSTGQKGACFSGCPVAERVAIVRPWKDRSKVTTTPPPQSPARLRADLDGGLVGLGAAVAEEHPAAVGQGGQPRGQPRLGLGVVQVGAVDQPSHLLADRGNHPRVTVAEVADREAGDEVQVPGAVDRPISSAPSPATISRGWRA